MTELSDHAIRDIVEDDAVAREATRVIHHVLDRLFRRNHETGNYDIGDYQVISGIMLDRLVYDACNKVLKGHLLR